LKRPLNSLIRAAVLGLLRLRYRARVAGVDEVARRGASGILFLPNHPALIDPVIVMTALYPRFQPRPLADRDQVDRPVVRWLAGRIGAVTIPDPLIYGDACREEVERGIDRCAEVLSGGGNMVIYPAGHIMRRRHEDLAAASAVETLLRRVPNVRVVLVRTRGLWGSAFSRASGAAPALGKVIPRAIRALLLNGVFFSPRREVTLDLCEPADMPRAAERNELNRYLERFYNADAPPNTYVPYTRWERGGARAMPEPDGGASRDEAADVPAATRDQVIRYLQKVTGRAAIRDEDVLSRDLGLDSLSAVEVAMWVESEFGFPVGDGTGLETVKDVLLAARGHAVTAAVALKPVPAAWFRGTATGADRSARGRDGARPSSMSSMEGRPPCRPSSAVARATMPEGATLTEVLLRQIARGPDRAIVADQMAGVRTYRDLLTAVLALKPEIERIPGDYVGVMLPASAMAGIVYVAVLLAGKIPVMVNWTIGARNMTHALDLLDVRGVLTAERVVQKIESQSGSLGELKARFVLLEEVARRLGWPRKAAAWVGARVGWRRLGKARTHATAVVLFTSGSESLPKAVPLTHANLLANLRDVCAVFPFGYDDRLIGILPPFHSFGLTATLLLPLCAGVPVVYHPNPTEGAALARTIAAYRVTLLLGTPTFLGGILRAARDRELDTLRAVISGAEKCPDQVFEMLGRCWPQIKVVEGYGITECSPVVSLGDVAAPRAGTIGRVLPSVEHAVMDLERGQRAAPGKAGMLLVRGPSIFGGYLNYEGASPFVEFEGRPWYRTGDLVSEDAGGVLTFAGRLKRFVKLGGEMISLPAIEEILARHYVKPSDEEPVLAVEATPVELNPELVLFTVRDLDREEVNARIKAAGLSPLHNIRVIRKVAKIPTLGTGKTDYRALKTLFG
jgi:long-chain-fatty-acid--[acyl-carrier-protein] ligase